jgi:cytochrome c peroxidase
MPIQNEVEMGSTLPELTAKLSSTAFYPTLFQNAFGAPEVTPERISKALAQFVRSIKSYGSKFDQAIAAGTPGNPNYSAFTPQELLGRDVFHGSGACNQCHTTNAQVGDVPRNVGLDATITDAGAGNGRFKVPTLRDVALRGRFMHDGRFTSLEQVIDFYSTGIQFSTSLDSRLVVDGHARQFNFTQEEKDALIAFLNTLTDESVATNSLFTNPFVSLPGDFDGDGVVDAADLAVWSASFATGDGGGDADDDGDTDGADFMAWQRDLGMSWTDLAIPPGFGSVPEPTTILQLGICATGLAAAARRGSRVQRCSRRST